IQANSPAAAAGLSVGDSIELVDGKPMAGVGGSFDSWDATTLSAYLRDAAIEGREVELTASQTANDGNPIEQVTVLVAPRVPIQLESLLPPRAPAAADALGIAYEVDPLVVAVVPNSPAADAEVQPGDKLISARFILPDDVKDAESAENITLGSDGANWPMLLDALQRTPLGTEIEFTFERNGASEPILAKLKPQELDGVFLAERGFFFQPIERIRKADTFAKQLKYGWDETVESLTMVYRFLRKIGTQVPLTALGGPWTIAKAAGYSASEGLSTLLVFLTMLSANLAVINFLPIPLLDGGHMVFLAYEAIRGRPANEKFAVAMHTAGFVFIVSLMLFVFALDLNLIPRNL
ncbi:MAG: site-2 protease family protein, partial [Planctomycetes bacterium]|nr:site-2 protease family protein [Planctomycetota bacterium]